MKILKIVFVLLFALNCRQLTAQPLLKGPVCAVPGVVYQYEFMSRWDSASPSSVCVTGGLVADSNTTCFNGISIPVLKIVWTDSATGIISAHLPDGDTSFTVNITATLTGGAINADVQLQLIDSLTTPASLECSAPSGGGCSPQYQYLWQHSDDGINWENITNASGSTLNFSGSLMQSTYYRREVKDLSSGTIGYSNTAVVFISNYH